MSHSLLKIWVHGVFGTKYRNSLIKEKFETALYNHISDKLEELNCIVRIVNGIEDHVHCLFLLARDIAVASLFKNIKGESSHWVNENNFLNDKSA